MLSLAERNLKRFSLLLGTKMKSENEVVSWLYIVYGLRKISWESFTFWQGREPVHFTAQSAVADTTTTEFCFLRWLETENNKR